MRKETLQGATGYYTGRRRRRRTWKKVVSVLACIVVFCTTYALILPAITMEGKAYCGLEAHQHSPECYQKTLICGQEETEATAHVHSAECYAQQRQRICGQEEDSSVHTHTDACYDAEGALQCGLEEGQPVGHTHTDACYAVEETLQCGLEEGEVASGHTHTEACYESVLICQEEEHAHELRCYSNPEADVECAEVWERTMSDVTLTGDWGQDAVAIAQSQLGYQESEKNYEVGQDGKTKKGYTRYGAWYGEPYEDWCAMFASFCLEYAGIPETEMPREASCTRWVQKLTQAGRYQSEEYCPNEGDLVFFDLDEDGASDHVGLVAELIRDENGQIDKFKTIEGNVDNRVQNVTYELGEEKISGYAALPENPEAISETMPTETTPAETGNASETMPTETTPGETMPTETAPAVMGIAANWETEPQEPLTLQLDVKQNVELPVGKTVWLTFAPEVTHEYTFSIKPRNSRGCDLYDASGKFLQSNYIYSYCDDLIYKLTAGETYYIEIDYSSSSETIPVLLSLGAHTFDSKNDAGELVCDCGVTHPASGTCGENVQWSFADGVLTISGQGDMKNYANSETSRVPWYLFRDQITSVVVESGVTSIGDDAFRDCKLTSVTIPDSVISIGNYAFNNCNGLTSVTIPNGVTSIGSSAFGKCSKLTDITIPESVTSIRGGAFNSCSSLESISIPKGVTTIEASLFYGCAKLVNVTIPDGVTSIGAQAFRECKALESITLPDSVTSIGSEAFRECTALKSIQLPKGLTSIDDEAFYWCENLTSITLPDGLISIGDRAFRRCEKLTSFRIPGSVTSIGNSILYESKKISTVYWNAKEDVKVGSQWNTGSLVKIIVEKDTEILLGSSFSPLASMGCYALEFETPQYITLSALEADFLELPLTTLRESRYYIDEAGVFYRIDQEGKAHLAYYPEELENYQIPKSLPAEEAGGAAVPVVGVDSYAFYQATVSALTFEAPEQITQLEDFAFYHGCQLASINGQTAEQDVLALFPEAVVGTRLFENTKISHSSTITGDPLRYENDNLQLTISTKPSANREPAQDEEGAYLYYTGETAQTTITVSNPNSGEVASDTVVRVYYRFDAAKSKLNYMPRSEPYTVLAESGNEYQMTVSETNVPNCYCLELERPRQGDTISLILDSQYPSPTSGGGSATVWGGILTGQDVKDLGEALLPFESNQLLRWETVPDTFPITKELSSTGSFRVVGDGKSGAILEGLSYLIRMTRKGNTLEGMGKDYVTSVEFEDILTLPEGAKFSDAVVAAIKDGTYIAKTDADNSKWIFALPDQSEILTIYPYGSCYLTRDVSLALSESGQLFIRWRYVNSSISTEISSLLFAIRLQSGTVVVPQPEQGKTYTVHNQVAAEQHFRYSQDQHQQAECEASASAKAGSLQFTKSKYGGSYMGDTTEYTLTAYNPGVTNYERLARIGDPLPKECYLTPEQIAALFEADPERQLTLTIYYATLCAPGKNQTVTGIDGSSTATTILQNTGTDTAYHGMEEQDSDCVSLENSTIVMTWAGEGQIKITVDDGQAVLCAPTAAEIQAVLDNACFVITPKTQYALSWDLTGGTGQPRILVGGERLQRKFQVTFKDTFMFLDHDQKYQYPYPNRETSVKVNNIGYAYDAQGEQITYAPWEGYFYRDFSLTKEWFHDGEAVDAETELAQGSVLDYTLKVIHSGSGSYGALPLVDHMSGAQALLAPKALNEGAAWASTCPTVTAENGREYYLLKVPGTYSQVWTSEEQLADSVTVTQSSSGLDTVIKWYFINYTGSRTDRVAYQAMVCPKDTVPGALAYSIGNETWLSDHQSHRLYNSLPGWNGVTFRFDKKIVEAVGDTGPGATYCPVHEGETIVYRLTLESGLDEEGNPVELTLYGYELYDALPLSVEGSRWSQETVQLSYVEGYTVVNGDHWEVTDPDSDQQYIRWQDDFSITFQGTAHIYVTLTFPDGIPWEEYARRYGGATLINTFHVLNRQVSVTHDLATTGQVRLQKGVSSSIEGHADGRFYYSSNDTVTYYVSLYNGGTTKLYLTDMQDRLPRGFSCGTINISYSGTTYGQYTPGIVYRADGSQASLRIANYTRIAEEMEDGSIRLRFHFSPFTSSNSVHYDEKRDMCYLNPGEAIIFSYAALTNERMYTDERALNIISMPYYDFGGEGVTVDTDSATVAKNSETYMPNDGGCDLEDNGQAVSHGFTGGTTDTQWLTSEVTVARGAIKPGITKALTSKKDSNGVVTQNPISASSMDELTWTITVENDGTEEINDYTLTDVMQAPYMFTGEVKIQTDRMGLKYAPTVFTVTQTSQPDVLRINGEYSTNNNWTRELTVDGPALHIKAGLGPWNDPFSADLSLAFSRNTDGNIVMSIRLSGKRVGIGPGGYGILTLTTKDPAGTLQNKQFLNTCFITPMSQVWDNTTNKGNMTTLQTPFAEEARPTVRNSAPVTTSYGYVTSSIKRITQTDNPANTAASTDEINYIVLESAKKTFDYTLSVSNDTPKAMDKLILIDGLPEVGDHTAFLENDPRFSAFQVSLTDSPNFTVTVTDNASGAETVLDPASYQVQYSTATEFTSEDWKGTSTWSTDPTGARSIRLVIEDTTGTRIPQESTVSLRFTCQIDGPAEPGTIAWNSFGYHYSLLDEAWELEAAPLKVGVKVPTIPKLKKQLVDHSGLPVAAEQDETFSFLLYEGAPLDGSFETEESLTQALTAAGKDFRKFTLAVPAGQTASETISLKSEGWEWMNRQEYTMVELPGSEEYGFRRFDLSSAAAYRFTYLCAEDKVITCENTSLRWDVALTKQDPTGATLAGAVFALYSPEKSEQIAAIPEEYASLEIRMEIQRDESAWYLAGVGTTGADGALRWSDLLQEHYYLAELKTPDGYHLPDSDGWRLLESKRETQGVYAVNVINISEHEMPETGSMGSGSYTIGGLLLTAGAEILLLYRKKRRGKGAASFS